MPLLIPNIWVLTLPATAVLHISELFITTLGEIAEGGVLSTVTVELTVLVSEYALGKNKINVISNIDIK